MKQLLNPLEHRTLHIFSPDLSLSVYKVSTGVTADKSEAVYLCEVHVIYF